MSVSAEMMLVPGNFRLFACGGLLLLAGLVGCGGGNRLISNTNGEVIRGELTLDSIPTGPETGRYVIGYGDILDIVFLYNEELSGREIRVRPDGRISYPYIGEVRVAGMTVPELDSLLTVKFSEIIRDPDITVIVSRFEPPLVYVMGEVTGAGGYEYREGMTLLNALALGRGPTKEGKRDAVLVIRRTAPNHIIGIQVDLGELLKGNRFDLNIPLEPYDIVYVPRSYLQRAEDFVESVTSILEGPLDVYIKGWHAANVDVTYEFYRRVAQNPVP